MNNYVDSFFFISGSLVEIFSFSWIQFRAITSKSLLLVIKKLWTIVCRLTFWLRNYGVSSNERVNSDMKIENSLFVVFVYIKIFSQKYKILDFWSKKNVLVINFFFPTINWNCKYFKKKIIIKFMLNAN